MRTDGVGALNLNEVARRVGMKTPSLYTYFESKHALCDALFLLGMREYRREFLDLLADREVDGTLIEDVIAHYMAFADANPDLYALVFERPVPGFVPSEESLQEAAALLEDGLSQFEAALASGAIRSGLDAAQTRDLFIAVAHGLTALKRANEPDAADGTGRFAPLVPAAAALLQAAWQIPGDRSQQNKGDQQ
jgi:AcrR family transcriptional regulator